MTRILIDIVHPADVRFFREPIARLRAQGAPILCLAREKDITCDLLERFEIPYALASRQGEGPIGLGLELLRRDWAMVRAMNRFKPDVATGFGGVAIAHAGRLAGVRTVAFYDHEPGRLQMALTLPFIDEWHVPESWRGPAPAGKTRRFNSFKELSDLHPARFKPCPERARALGAAPDRANIFLRLSAQRAAHDWGARSLDATAFLAALNRVFGPVALHVSCEGDAPEPLRPYLYRGALDQVHHLLAACDLAVTDGASMAAEAGVLGVPSIVTNARAPGYVSEFSRRGLMFTARADGPFDRVLAEARLTPAQREARRRALLFDKVDMADYVVACLSEGARRPRR